MNTGFLDGKLQERFRRDAYRRLQLASGEHDFFSNDYLGVAKNGLIETALEGQSFSHGSTGSRLLAGNYPLIEEIEQQIASFHDAPAALVYNSGYDANIGLLSAVAGRGDTILYDQLSHASIRDGIRLSLANAFSFRHNDVEDLEKKLQGKKGNVFVVTESVFSMDGDQAPVIEMTSRCEHYGANLIVDEAHATGVVGALGEGLMQRENLHHRCFARVHTFGKALGCHGAAILGSELLRNYLINFSRAFIYTTALPPVSAAAIRAAYELFPKMQAERKQLGRLITHLSAHRQITTANGETYSFKPSATAIQCLVIPGNERVKTVANKLLDQGFDIRPILHPTVPEGEERLRIALHSYNTVEELERLIAILKG
ncbi:MAG TPA: 8-amino-7-oxononanoate synthase [Puia sp.]|nr:8-amino-7-oxononanoate synthase [Puia sp.]